VQDQGSLKDWYTTEHPEKPDPFLTEIRYPQTMTTRQRSIRALLLLAPIPTLGIASVLIWWPGPVGRSLFSAAKVWLLLFPVLWHLGIDRGRLSLSPVRKGGLGVGALVGLAMAAVIGATYWLIAVPRIDPAMLRSEVADMGLATPSAYALGALYWIFINSVVEEYVFRWFVQSRCETLMPRWIAIGVSAAIFTTHHVVAMATFLNPVLTALASAGVFIGGATWSWMANRYGSIWPGWVAHALADVAVFACGWHLLFG
jgi:membrane protease YdiL (CAAX protease family)